jgi:hypothetical protein
METQPDTAGAWHRFKKNVFLSPEIQVSRGEKN